MASGGGAGRRTVQAHTGIRVICPSRNLCRILVRRGNARTIGIMENNVAAADANHIWSNGAVAALSGAAGAGWKHALFRLLDADGKSESRIDPVKPAQATDTCDRRIG